MRVPKHDKVTPGLPGTPGDNPDGDALIPENPRSLEADQPDLLPLASFCLPQTDQLGGHGEPDAEPAVAIRINAAITNVSNEPFHCDDDALFQRVEAERRTINIAVAGQERLFVSHCWRNAATQYRKRRILAHLSTPAEAGGPGLVYWGDFLDLQAQGPIPWRKEIEEGIAACSKFVALVDKAWLTSYNCLQELVMAIENAKPIVVLILDGEGWELLTVPGGANRAAEEAELQADDNDDSAWTDSSYAAPLCSYAGEEIVPGKKMSAAVMRSLFSQLASINMCPCRQLEENTRGWDSLLATAAEYVKKDLVYYKEHAQLKGKAAAWEKAVQDGGPKPLLQKDESVFWQGWISKSREHALNPPPTELMERFVKASLNQAARRLLLIRLMALLLAFVLAVGAAASTVLAIRSTNAEKDAVMKAEEAFNASNWAKAAQLEAELQAGRATAAQSQAQQEAIKAQLGSRLSTSLAVTTLLDKDPHVSTWRLKLLYEALDRLPTFRTTATNGTLLSAGRELLKRPTVPLGLRQGLPSPDACPTQSCAPEVLWSPDGRTLASRSWPRVETVSIWAWLDNGTMNTSATQILHVAEPDSLQNRLASVVWAPDSSRLTTVNNDLTVRIWTRLDDGTVNTTSPQVLHHNRTINRGRDNSLSPKVCWSPDSTMLAVASLLDKEIHIFARLEDGSMNTTAGEVLYGYSGVLQVAWSPGVLHFPVLVSESDDGALLIWQQTTNGGMNATVSQVLHKHTEELRHINWAPDGLLLATSGFDRGIRIWERFEDGSINTAVIQVLGHTSANSPQAVSLEWAPDGSAIAAGYSDSSIWVWQKQPGTNMLDESSLKILHGGWGVSWSPDSSAIAAIGSSEYVSVWFMDMILTDSPAQQLTYSQPLLSADTTGISWVPGSNNTLTTGSDDGAIQLWNVYPHGLPGAAPQVLELQASGGIKSISWASNGLALTSVSADGDMTSFWRSDSSKSFDPLQRIAAVMPDGGQTGAIPAEGDDGPSDDYYDNYGYYMDSSPDLLPSYSLTAAEWAPGGTTLAAAEANDVLLWHVAENLDADSLLTPPQLLIGHSGPVRTLTWAQGGELLASGAVDGTIHLWHVGQENSNASLFSTLDGHRGWVLDLDFSPDGSKLASCSSDGTVRIWSSKQNWTGAPQMLLGHSDWVWSIAWSPDGGSLASASADSYVMVWGTLTDGTIDTAAPQTLRGHKGYVYALAWAPHGSWLASGSADSSIRIWARNPNGVFDISSPQLLEGQGGSVRALAWSLDGLILASGSADGGIRLWGLLTVSSMKAAMVENPAAIAAESLRLTDAEILEFGLPFTLFEYNSSESQLLPPDGFEGNAAPQSSGGTEQLSATARPSVSPLNEVLLDFMRQQNSSSLEWSWSEEADVCDWSGTWFAYLECEQGTLTGLSMGSEHFTGPLPDSWSIMSDLKQMTLQWSPFTGQLPESWSTMTALEKMHLINNKLITGSLPESWSKMSSLKSLAIRDPSMVSGPLPQAWSALSTLSDLTLAECRITGPLPKEWSAFSSMHTLTLGTFFETEHGNRLTGSLPDEWSNMAGLVTLNLGGNNLTGSLPESWSAIPNINDLSLARNRLQGELPQTWSAMSVISSMHLGDNQLTGPLPEAWSSIANSSPSRPQMTLANNQLTGTVPEAWGNITTFEMLDMSGNNITGSLPEPLRSCMVMREDNDDKAFAFDFNYGNPDCFPDYGGYDYGSYEFGSW